MLTERHTSNGAAVLFVYLDQSLPFIGNSSQFFRKFGRRDEDVDAGKKIFDAVDSCACVSRPMTASYSTVDGDETVMGGILRSFE